MFHDDNPRVVDHPQPEQPAARVTIGNSGEWRLSLFMYEDWVIVDAYQRYEISLSGHATVYVVVMMLIYISAGTASSFGLRRSIVRAFLLCTLSLYHQ